MNHFVLLIVCVLSVEIFTRWNYIDLISSIVGIGKKAVITIFNKNISDHWKENIITKYSMQMIRYSLQMLLIIFLIIFIFFIADNFLSGFLSFTFSLVGIIESLLFGFAYTYFKKLFVR